MIDYLFAPVFAFIFMFIVFRPFERAYPAKPEQKFFRPGWWTDLCFFLGSHLCWVILIYLLLGYFQEGAAALTPSVLRQAVAAQPFWLQAIEALFLSDLLIYWGHRLQHRIEFLWRFHSIHHSSEHLDWLAAYREHPLDTLYTMGLVNLPAILMGFPLESIAAVIVFRGLWAVYIHSNVRFPIGPLRVLIGAPELHRWHHAKQRDAGNYANISPLMDVMFGTYTCPDHDPEEFGIREPISKSYIGQLTHPFRRR
ncbi:MAG: sterol desaturase family protein [Alphaproteobacteria bacterium]|nr:sterol desaturase family protein [Alphaproteobacteria bacterium]MCB9974936.1 sterol desaturase family protein [Rhodospirillales bacterium]